MNINNVTNQLFTSFVFLTMALPSHSAEPGTDIRNSYVEFGLGSTYTDNAYKNSSDQISGTSTTADLEFDYNRQQETNNIALNYQAEYSKESEEELQDGINWFGTAKISQQVFSEKLRFNLEHIHQRYLIDQSQPDLVDNTDDKDLLEAGLTWFIPFTSKATFDLSASHTETWFSGSDSASDLSSNEAALGWEYKITDTSQIKLDGSAMSSKFDDFSTTYHEYSLGATYSQQYRLGSYSLSLGETWTDGLNEVYSGWYYSLSANAELQRHLFTLNASRELTNSSSNFGSDESITFNQAILYWNTFASLDHQYKMQNDKLISNLRLYFERNEELASVQDNSAYQDTIDKYGFSGSLTWLITQDLSSTISLGYYESDLADYSTKKFTDAELSVNYNLGRSFYIQVSTAFEKQSAVQTNLGYDEHSYTARVAYRY